MYPRELPPHIVIADVVRAPRNVVEALVAYCSRVTIHTAQRQRQAVDP